MQTLFDLLDTRPRIAFTRVRQFAEQQPPAVDTTTPELEFFHQDELEEWQQRAADGEAQAQWLMGRAAEKGLIEPAGLDVAEAWYAKAAGQGHPEAINDLTVIAHRRCDSSPEAGEAIIAAYNAAADGGVAEALCNLGLAYHHYRGFTGRAKGNVFFEEAIAEGVSEAAKLMKDARSSSMPGVPSM